MNKVLYITLFLFSLGGCGKTTSYLIPTPNLSTELAYDPFLRTPKSRQSPEIEMLYVTDRNRDLSGYTYDRSHHLVMGTCSIRIGDETTSWLELRQDSLKRKRSKKYPLSLSSIKELVVLPDSLINRVKDFQSDDANDLITHFVTETDHKEVYLFVHGYNNSLEKAAFKLGQLWHFMGRVGVPIVYSWPAGGIGYVRGYSYDRESGEFTVLHLKQFLKLLIAHPDIDKIHLIAHSRGTDVLMTAVRELFLEYKHNGGIKFANIILIAPDIDWGVAEERIIAENLDKAADQFTMYVSAHDKMIQLSEWLSGSKQRVGHLRESNVIGVAHRINFIDVRSVTKFKGHTYFLNHPAALSDLILLLKYNNHPGADFGRPLIKKSNGFWELRENYPRP